MVNTDHCLVTPMELLLTPMELLITPMELLITPMELLIAPIQKTTEVEIITLDIILHLLLPDQYQHMKK